MNADQKTAVIGLSFVLICLYSLIVFQDAAFEAELLLVGLVSFSLQENLIYFAPPVFFLGFLIFLKIRRERETSESSRFE